MIKLAGMFTCLFFGMVGYDPAAAYVQSWPRTRCLSLVDGSCAQILGPATCEPPMRLPFLLVSNEETYKHHAEPIVVRMAHDETTMIVIDSYNREPLLPSNPMVMMVDHYHEPWPSLPFPNIQWSTRMAFDYRWSLIIIKPPLYMLLRHLSAGYCLHVTGQNIHEIHGIGQGHVKLSLVPVTRMMAFKLINHGLWLSITIINHH